MPPDDVSDPGRPLSSISKGQKDQKDTINSNRLAEEIQSANSRAGQAPWTPPEGDILRQALIASPPVHASRPLVGRINVPLAQPHSVAQPHSARGSNVHSGPTSSLASAGKMAMATPRGSAESALSLPSPSSASTVPFAPRGAAPVSPAVSAREAAIGRLRSQRAERARLAEREAERSRLADREAQNEAAAFDLRQKSERSRLADREHGGPFFPQFGDGGDRDAEGHVLKDFRSVAPLQRAEILEEQQPRDDPFPAKPCVDDPFPAKARIAPGNELGSEQQSPCCLTDPEPIEPVVSPRGFQGSAGQELEELRSELHREQRRVQDLRRRNQELDRRMLAERRRVAEYDRLQEHAKDLERESAEREEALKQAQMELEAVTKEAAQLRAEAAEVKLQASKSEMEASAAKSEQSELRKQVNELSEARTALLAQLQMLKTKNDQDHFEKAKLKQALGIMQDLIYNARAELSEVQEKVKLLTSLPEQKSEKDNSNITAENLVKQCLAKPCASPDVAMEITSSSDCTALTSLTAFEASSEVSPGFQANSSEAEACLHVETEAVSLLLCGAEISPVEAMYISNGPETSKFVAAKPSQKASPDNHLKFQCSEGSGSLDLDSAGCDRVRTPHFAHSPPESPVQEVCLNPGSSVSEELSKQPDASIEATASNTPHLQPKSEMQEGRIVEESIVEGCWQEEKGGEG
eukprot:TRINITY_DN108804_c0_g1_i1.p1 TRINITY_DN108804_c0_g1~~TRINITY_DN108804_c0_g1_i1.p1  ORF type:complete len:695 (+),score=151.90 TRINITY_DN108804_c0_g1_i1:91-2175(+)